MLPSLNDQNVHGNEKKQMVHWFGHPIDKKRICFENTPQCSPTIHVGVKSIIIPIKAKKAKIIQVCMSVHSARIVRRTDTYTQTHDVKTITHSTDARCNNISPLPFSCT